MDTPGSSPHNSESESNAVNVARGEGADIIPIEELMALRAARSIRPPYVEAFLRVAECYFRRGTLSRGQIAAFLLEAPPPSISHYPQHHERPPDL